ncbi:hypothetical protein DSM106972_008550 [Dulcicalothrix desertica PCC 7102]|uniref:Uncharacterized protein n=1 Tax=Dulcicalothrix desertica PCC 7102 TaxID=232991 RepID=A0A3S1ATM2_9CYAN|nr:hypothetical protein [Dulcicalothrix desertica]RUT08802.1 hypothetical protein DSM106972_008550 [Dulcicalothrix desertica PCC 7102]TWH44181.1 hypothetical protein CAL7102_07964 [Dulcicalothrix desertica PCC 7102]
MMIPSKYWTIWLIDSPRIERNQLHNGYRPKQIKQAFEFIQCQFPDLVGKTRLSPPDNKYIQTTLWRMFCSTGDIQKRALAGLCLRCYVSERILITCKTIPHIYNTTAQIGFTYIDLLPCVLNDDGAALVILDCEGKTQYILNHDGTTRPVVKEAELFTVEILGKFNPNLDFNESLENWTMRLTRQNEKLKLVLWDFGIGTASDWGLLCKHVSRSLEQVLQKGDSEIIKAFQQVYQRDRIKLRQKGRCTEPTASQQLEILQILQQQHQHIVISSAKELIYHLKRIAETLRQEMLCKKTGSPKTVPTVIYDAKSGNYIPHPELPYYIDPDPEDVELEQWQQNFTDWLDEVLYQAVAEVIPQRIQDLEKSKGYKNFAHRFPEGLQYYYHESKSLSEIARIWGIEWSRARRIFQLDNFLEIIQYRTEEKFIERLLQVLNQSQFKKISHDSEHFKKVAVETREFIWNKVFKDAKAETLAGKNLSRNSLVAQKIRTYLDYLNILVS